MRRRGNGRRGRRRRRLHRRKRAGRARLLPAGAARRADSEADLRAARQGRPALEEGDDHPDRRPAGADGQTSAATSAPSPRPSCRPARGWSRSRPRSPTTGWRAMRPTRGCRTCPGRPTSSGSAWARTATPPRSSPGPTCRTRSTRPRPAARSASCPTRCRPTRRCARVTLTRAAILSARTILITITGQKKRELLEQGDRRRPVEQAADRPRAGRGRAADRHPLGGP